MDGITSQIGAYHYSQSDQSIINPIYFFPRITQTKNPWKNAKELQLESSLETSPLFPKDHAALKKTCNTLTSSGPDGRVMLTLERITFATETMTELVTVRDPRSTISITYDGCIPPDAIDTFECPYGYGFGSDEAMSEDVSPVISPSEDTSVDTPSITE